MSGTEARKTITEEDGTHKAWMGEAQKMTMENLQSFLKKLSEDYEHDYGTICHAIAAAAVAAAWAIERTPQGGITGFQAGAITWEMVRGWNPSLIGDCGARLITYDDLLYPQYADKFQSISPDVWEKVKAKAVKKLNEKSEDAHPSVIAHWRAIADGQIPFQLSLSEN